MPLLLDGRDELHAVRAARCACCLQVELKLMVAMVVSSLHVTLDTQRMSHLRSVKDYSQETLSTLNLIAARTPWLRMRPRASE
eukprot:jgi/Ulvmu1/7749/UM039_0057.1